MPWDDLEQYEMPGQQPIPTVQAGGGMQAPFAASMSGPQEEGLDFTPAASPEEEARRRSMWTDIVTKFQTNPNLQRALALTGAMMMQPIQPQQTTGGALANAAVVGMNAYNMGQTADIEKARSERKERREERELGMRETESAERVTTARTERPLRTRQLGAAAGRAEEELDITRATKEQVVQRARLENDKLKQAIDAGNEEEAVKAQERINRIQQLYRERALRENTPLDKELQAQFDKFDLLRQQVRGATAKAGMDEEKYEAWKALSPAEKKSAITTKTATTAIQAGAVVYGQLWESSPELKKQYPDKSSYIDARMSGAKRQSAFDDLKDYMEATKEEPEKRDRFVMEQLTARINATMGRPAESAAGRVKQRKEEVTQPGDIYKGYRWKGGDKSDPKNWEKI